jgi:NitT/TauT family transport system permease protein
MKISSTQSKKYRLIGIAIWLVLWEALYLIINKDIYLPSPKSVLYTVFDIIEDENFLRIIASTLLRVIGSFTVSAILGISTGFFCGLNDKIYHIFEPLILLIRSTPIISVIIIAIIWFKSDYVPVFTGLLICYPIIWTNMVQGIRETDSKLIEMCKVYKIKPFQVFQKVYMPSAKPYIKAGFTTSMGLAWKVVATTEVLSMPRYAIGIGNKLHDARIYLEIPELMAWTMIIILFSYIFENISQLLFKKG